MTRARFVARVLKPAIWIAALLPAARLVWGVTSDDLGPEPVHTIQEVTGLATLVILFCTLAITPLRRLTGVDELVRVRRPVGLFAFFWASVHAATYFVLDQELSIGDIAADVAKHPWVTVGFLGWLLLIPLAVTSTRGWVRRLGRRWRELHRLVYVVPVLGVLHFLWLVKRDESEPLTYGAILLGIFGVRLWTARTASARRRSRPTPDGAPGAERAEAL